MNISVITSYPEKNTIHAQKTVGGASYSKLLFSALKKINSHAKITIFAETFSGKKSSYTENGMTVKRVWERGNLLSLISAIQAVYKKDDQSVALSFEAFMFGNPLFSLLTLLYLGFLRLIMQKKTYVLMHQVVGDFRILHPGIKGQILNVVKTIFYGLVSGVSTNVIVFEEHLKSQFGSYKNVVVIPHIVTTSKQLDQVLARKQLGLSQKEKYVLCFGYLAPYKGLDSLVKLWPTQKTLKTQKIRKSDTPRVRDSDAPSYLSVLKTNQPKLILAGGINPNHKNNKAVVTYAEDLLKKAKENKNILTTGFVKEADIEKYFSAVDAVVIPYVTFLSSSGPLALALSHNKPVIFAEELKSYSKTKDIANALKKAGLEVDQIVFKRTSESLTKAFSFNTKKAVIFAKEIAKLRSEKEIAKQYAELLLNTQKTQNISKSAKSGTMTFRNTDNLIFRVFRVFRA